MKMKVQFLKTELGDVLLKLRWEVFILSMPTVPTLGTQTMVNVVYQTCQKMLVYFYVQFISIKITNIRVPYCTRGDKTGRSKCGDDYRNRCCGPGRKRNSVMGTPPVTEGNTDQHRTESHSNKTREYTSESKFVLIPPRFGGWDRDRNGSTTPLPTTTNIKIPSIPTSTYATRSNLVILKEKSGIREFTGTPHGTGIQQ